MTVSGHQISSPQFRVLRGRTSEDRSRRPVVLVHGIGMSHRYLSRLHDVLGEQGPVFSIDLPGFAGLSKPGFDMDVVSMGRALSEVIASLDAGPVILVGHSMGAQWVTEVALHTPELVDHLVVIGPVADAAHRSMPAQLAALAVDSLRETPLINSIVFTDYARCGIRWYLTQVRHLLAYRLEDRVVALTMPLLVIRGQHDPIAGLSWCRMLRDRAPDAALAIVPGQSHVVQHSAPRAVAAAIRAYAPDPVS